MKNLIMVISVLMIAASSPRDTNEQKMDRAKIVEMVSFKRNDGFTQAEAKKAMEDLSLFVSSQPGFISRTTSISAEGKFLDLVFWEDLQSAQKASELAMKDESLLEIFSVINQESMLFEHYEIFHRK